MAKKQFRAFQNVVLTLYLASFIKFERKKRVDIRGGAVRSPVPPKVECANTGLFCL